MDLSPCELLLAALIRCAIRDARDGRTEQLRAEAASYVWSIAPTVAERANLHASKKEPEPQLGKDQAAWALIRILAN